jgi:hypothetical protein
MKEGAVYFSTHSGHIPGRGRGLLWHCRCLCLEQKRNLDPQPNYEHGRVTSKLETSFRECTAPIPARLLARPTESFRDVFRRMQRNSRIMPWNRWRLFSSKAILWKGYNIRNYDQFITAINTILDIVCCLTHIWNRLQVFHFHILVFAWSIFVTIWHSEGFSFILRFVAKLRPFVYAVSTTIFIVLERFCSI